MDCDGVDALCPAAMNMVPLGLEAAISSKCLDVHMHSWAIRESPVDAKTSAKS